MADSAVAAELELQVRALLNAVPAVPAPIPKKLLAPPPPPDSFNNNPAPPAPTFPTGAKTTGAAGARPPPPPPAPTPPPEPVAPAPAPVEAPDHTGRNIGIGVAAAGLVALLAIGYLVFRCCSKGDKGPMTADINVCHSLALPRAPAA
jgi:hypothetical protein